MKRGIPCYTVQNKLLVLLSLLALVTAQDPSEEDEEVELIIYISAPIIGGALLVLLGWFLYSYRRRHLTKRSTSQQYMVQVSQPHTNTFPTAVVFHVRQSIPQPSSPRQSRSHSTPLTRRMDQRIGDSGNLALDDQHEALVNPVPPYSLYPELRISTLSPAPAVTAPPMTVTFATTPSSYASANWATSPTAVAGTATAATAATTALYVVTSTTASLAPAPTPVALSFSHAHATLAPAPTAMIESSSNTMPVNSAASPVSQNNLSLYYYTPRPPPPSLPAASPTPYPIEESLYPSLSRASSLTASSADLSTGPLYPSIQTIEPPTITSGTLYPPQTPLSFGPSASFTSPSGTATIVSSLYPTLPPPAASVSPPFPSGTPTIDQTFNPQVCQYPSDSESPSGPSRFSYGGGMVPSLQPAPSIQPLP